MMTVIVGNYPTLITSRAKSSAFTPPFADTCQTDRPADRVNTRPINSIRNVTAYPVQIFYPLASSELLLISHHVLPPLYTLPIPRFRSQFSSPFPPFLHPVSLSLLSTSFSFESNSRRKRGRLIISRSNIYI